MKKKIFILISLMGLFSSCAEKNSDHIFKIVSPVHLETVDSFDLNDIAMGQLRSISLDDERIYLMFKNPNEVVVLDKNYTILRKITAEGEGPGEFLNPEMITTFKDEIWVGDAGKYTVEIFDKELNYKTTLNLDSRPWSMSSNRSNLVVATQMGWGSTKLTIWISDTTYHKTIPSSGDHPLDIIGNTAVTDMGEILFSRQYRNENYIFNDDFSMKTFYKIPFYPAKSPTTERQGILLPRFDLVKEIMVYGQNIYTLSGLITENGQTLLQIDRSGAVQKTYLLKTAVTVTDMFDGTLFGFNPNSNRVVKYIIE